MTMEVEIRKAGIGRIRPFYRTFNYGRDAIDFFAKQSDYGRKQGSILLESADIVKKYGEKSIGGSNPCLKVLGKGSRFEIIALNELGIRFLNFIKEDFRFVDNLKVSGEKISGTLKVKRRFVSEEERLRLKTHADILRKVAFKFKPTIKVFGPYAGLFGVIGYDFIDQFELLPSNKRDLLKQPDYEMNFYDNLFIIDHKNSAINFIANALVMDNNYEKEARRCSEILENYQSTLSKEIPEKRKFRKGKMVLETDVGKKEFIRIVKELKRHILAGDVFQVVPSRTVIASYCSEPLDIYRKLRMLNPSPYMFYFNSSSGILLGSSPETFLRVEGDGRKRVEIRPIAGTKPRGLLRGKIDPDLDSRYEAELKLDKKELAEHTMLIDLARNDVARISEPGTRHCDEPFIVEKYSHVQHLVSNVSGILKKDLDALHAYLGSMNMGTLTGAPKVEAMKLIREKEKNKRGFYGGSIGYLTPSGDFDSAIIIRSMSLKGNKAYIRAGAGIVYDSVPEKEFEETEKKAKACLRAIELANGGKE